MLEAAAAECEQRYGALDAPWGDFMRFQSGAVDLAAGGADGFLGAFRVMRYAPVAKGSARQKATFGDTFVACVEFGTPVRAQVLMSYGNSSQPGSPHATDQLPLLARKELRPAWRTRAEVEANLRSREQF
jgi:acyl-homoserine-lactone acylase